MEENDDQPYPKFRQTFDSQGRMTRKDFMTAEGNLVKSYLGYASVTYEYDDTRKQRTTRFLGVDGMPCFGKLFGIAGQITQSDDDGNSIKSVYLDTEGNPFRNRKSLVAGWLAEYDASGRHTKLVYIETEGKPCINNRGIAGWNKTYVETENTIITCYFDITGKPCSDKDGVASFRLFHDAEGIKTKVGYYDLDGVLIREEIENGYYDPEINPQEIDDQSISGRADQENP